MEETKTEQLLRLRHNFVEWFKKDQLTDASLEEAAHILTKVSVNNLDEFLDYHEDFVRNSCYKEQQLNYHDEDFLLPDIESFKEAIKLTEKQMLLINESIIIYPDKKGAIVKGDIGLIFLFNVGYHYGQLTAKKDSE